jgi:alkaline phosphatase D
MLEVTLLAAAELANGLKIGEVDQDSAIVWVRTTQFAERLDDDTVPGVAGEARLTHWSRDTPEAKQTGEWVPVAPERDFTHQFKLEGLQAGTDYELRCETRDASVEGRFRTAPALDDPRRIVFTVVTGQGYHRRDDPASGHRIYPAMTALVPDFFVHTGDVVYYDKPKPFAKTIPVARHKWNRMYALPFQRDFHLQTACYFIRDDHDTLKNDCWPGQRYGELTWDDGIRLFQEQVPTGPVPYRTIRWGTDVQIWLLEGREFRDPNTEPDGPDKTLLGTKQIEWLERTLAESNASFRIVISATPLIGPDRVAKRDSHANAAFRTEGERLCRMLADLGNAIVVCGDRHWQYASVDPVTGLREFSCGPTSDAHAGGYGTTPKPMHRFLRVKGGFLSVTIDREEGVPVAIFRHHDVAGTVVHEEVVRR